MNILKSPLVCCLLLTAAIAPANGSELTYEKTLTTTGWSQYMPHSNFLPQYEANSTDAVYDGSKSGKVAAGCAATAYAQLTAFHQWPVLIDDTIHAYLQTQNTAFYPAEYRLSRNSKIDWSKIYSSYSSRTCSESERYAAGLLQLWIDIHASMQFTASGSNSTTALPMYNEWYEGLNYFKNVASTAEDCAEKRAAIIAAIRESIEAGVPLMAGINSPAGAHVVLVDGVRIYDDGSAQYRVNYGWAGDYDGWYSMDLELESKNHSLSGVYSLHVPRKKAQVEPLALESGPSATLNWHFPKYWSDKLSGFRVRVLSENAAAETFTDDFSASVDDSCRLQPNTSYPEAFKLENNSLQLFCACDRAVKYTWPETFVPGETSVFSADVKSYYTGGNVCTIEMQVGGGEWTPIYTWAEKDGDNDWENFSYPLADYAGRPCRFRVALVRRLYSSRTNAYGYQLKNLAISGVRRFTESATYDTAASARSYTVSALTAGKVHAFTVTPLFSDSTLVGEASKPVATIARAAAPTAPAIASVVRDGNAITDGVFFRCPYTDGASFTVTANSAVSALAARSGYPSLFGEDDISVTDNGDHTFTVTLTPPATMTAADALSKTDGQRMILTLEAKSAAGDVAMQDLSLAFCTSLDAGSGGGDDPEDPDAQYCYVYWNVNGGNEIAAWKVKVGSYITPPTPTRDHYKFVKWQTYGYDFDFQWNTMGGYGDEYFDAVWEYDENWSGGDAADCNVQFLSAGVLYSSTTVTAGNSVANPGTPARSGYTFLGWTVNDQLISFPYTVTADVTITASWQVNDTPVEDPDDPVEPDPTPAEEPVIAPVTSFDSHYAYSLTESIWDARKAAIKEGKTLFVLSGSDSCNNCAYVKSYLQSHAEEVAGKFIVYFARLQNESGGALMQGRLPQYGAYDPRTIDAFTGATDDDGVFHPAWAWYSGQDNAYLSYYGWAENQVVDVLNSADGKSYGAFTGFTLEGPDAAFVGMGANYRLIANFDDGTRMTVDHGVEWSVASGSGAIVCNDGTDYAQHSQGVGTLTASGGSTVKIRCRNTFYDFGADSNVLEKEVQVVKVDDVESLEITTLEFNLEDSTDVRLKCQATLAGGAKADALPEWTVALGTVDAYPSGSGLSAVQSPFVSMNASVNGKVDYYRGQKWSAQTGYVTYNGTDVQDHTLTVTATMNGKQASATVRVWGPSRMWPTQWSILTQSTVAPGGVVRVAATELKYTYKGEIHTTTDSGAATYDLWYYIDANHAMSESGKTVLAIPYGQGSDWPDALSGQLHLYARKTGGKYTGHDELNGGSKTLGYNPSWTACYGVEDNDEDSDNDGFTNHQELLLGTEPNNAASRWAFTSSHFDWPNSIYYRVMFMQSQFPGRTYTIEGSADGGETWHRLGIAPGATPGDAYITEKDVATAETCRLFRVKAKLDATGEEMTISGYGIWTDQTVTVAPGTVWQAMVADANDESYLIEIDFDAATASGTAILSIPAAQTLKSTPGRVVPAAALRADGWSFTRATDGVFLVYTAVKDAGRVRIESGTLIVDGIETATVTGLDESWTAQFPAFTEKFGDDWKLALIEPSGKLDAAGNPLPVWQDYILGTDPTDEKSRFTAKIEIENGVPKLTWEPALNGVDADGNCIREGVRVYRLMGANELNGGWKEVADGEEAKYRFFKVSVDMP